MSKKTGRVQEVAMEIQTSFVVVPFVNWFSLLLQYYSGITECVGAWKFRQGSLLFLTLHMHVDIRKGGPTVKWWLVLPHLECLQWPLPLVFPPHMFLTCIYQRNFCYLEWTSYGTVKSCDIRNGYSSCFHVHFWTPNSLFLEQPLMLSVYCLQSKNTLASMWNTL